MFMENLKSAVAQWKEQDAKIRKERRREPRWSNPYGKKIWELNIEHGKAKEAALAEIQAEYDAKMADLQALYREAEKDRPKGPGRGRPKRIPLTDEVKIQAYLAIESGETRTEVKNAINTALKPEELDAILAEGKELNERGDW